MNSKKRKRNEMENAEEQEREIENEFHKKSKQRRTEELISNEEVTLPEISDHLQFKSKS